MVDHKAFCINCWKGFSITGGVDICIAKQKTLPTNSLVAISYYNNSIINYTFCQTHSTSDNYHFDIFIWMLLIRPILYLLFILHKRLKSIIVSDKSNKIKLIYKNKCFIGNKINLSKNGARKIIITLKIQYSFKKNGYSYIIIHKK